MAPADRTPTRSTRSLAARDPAALAELASMIDHTLLQADATREEIERLCDEAKQHSFAAVCVNPVWVPLCVERLGSSAVHVCAAIAFPFGATSSDVKAFETKSARDAGAREFDVVINIGALRSGDDTLVGRDVEATVRAAGRGGIVKAVLETGCLSDDEKVRACKIVQRAGAHYVKTSTGFGPGGATVADVALLRSAVGERIGVKAAGGIRDVATALRMIGAGASRIGSSASVRIIGGDGPAPTAR